MKKYKTKTIAICPCCGYDTGDGYGNCEWCGSWIEYEEVEVIDDWTGYCHQSNCPYCVEGTVCTSEEHRCMMGDTK